MVTVKRFSAVWCGPCRQLAPVMNEIKGQFSNVKFEEIDVDTNPELVEQYNVISIPTVIIEKNGQLFERFTGASSKIAYVNAINESLK
jgi:thioredoxin 1